jgi:hypothetical protein
MNSKQTNFTAAIAVALAIILSTIVGGIGQATQFASATTIQEEDIDEAPVNTVESLHETHNAIMASLDSTSGIPDGYHLRWTNPGTVEGDGGVSAFVVDCAPGEIPGSNQVIGAPGVEIFQYYDIGSGADYISRLFLVYNDGEDDQVIKLGVQCLGDDDDGDDDGDGGGDSSSVTTTRVTNNNNVFVTNIVQTIVNNINTNITIIINNNTNVTIIPPPDNNTTDPGGNTTDPGTGGNTTDPGTGGNTTDPGTGGNTTELDALMIPDTPTDGFVAPPTTGENTTEGTTTEPEVVEEESETETTTTPPEEETTNTPAPEPEVVEEESEESTEESEETTTEEEVAEEEEQPNEQSTDPVNPDGGVGSGE